MERIDADMIDRIATAMENGNGWHAGTVVAILRQAAGDQRDREIRELIAKAERQEDGWRKIASELPCPIKPRITREIAEAFGPGYTLSFNTWRAYAELSGGVFIVSWGDSPADAYEKFAQQWRNMMPGITANAHR